MFTKLDKQLTVFAFESFVETFNKKHLSFFFHDGVAEFLKRLVAFRQENIEEFLDAVSSSDTTVNAFLIIATQQILRSEIGEMTTWLKVFTEKFKVFGDNLNIIDIINIINNYNNIV